MGDVERGASGPPHREALRARNRSQPRARAAARPGPGAARCGPRSRRGVFSTRSGREDDGLAAPAAPALPAAVDRALPQHRAEPHAAEPRGPQRARRRVEEQVLDRVVAVGLPHERTSRSASPVSSASRSLRVVSVVLMVDEAPRAQLPSAGSPRNWPGAQERSKNPLQDRRGAVGRPYSGAGCSMNLTLGRSGSRRKSNTG